MHNLSWNYIKEKWQNVGFQRYFRNMGWMFSARIFILAVAFFINAYIARYLGPANYGLLNYVISFIGLFAVLSSLGIENVANREIIKNHENKDLIVGTSFYLKLFGSLLALIIILIISPLTTRDPLLLILIGICSLTFIFSAFNIIEVYFQSQVLSKYPAIISIISGVISAILKIIVIYLSAGIIWLTAIYVFESMIVALGLIYFFINKGHSVKKLVFDKTTAILIVKDSWPLMLSGLAWSIYMKIDQVMIKNMIGNESVGIYAVAVKLSEFWYFVPGIICASIFPAIINAKKVSQKIYDERFKKLYVFMFWLSFLVAIFLSLFAPLIIHLLFGVKYMDAVIPLRIYVWAGIAVSLGYVATYHLLAENKTKINAISTTVGALTNIILNLILIPKYGINGSAFASFISYSIVTLSLVFFSKFSPKQKNIFSKIPINIK